METEKPSSSLSPPSISFSISAKFLNYFVVIKFSTVIFSIYYYIFEIVIIKFSFLI